MTDIVSQLVGALDRCIATLERIAHCTEADRLAAADEARAALTAAKAGGWLPIETAPKDASVLIHRSGDLFPGVAYLSRDRWYWSSSGAWAGHPTHWQPLPNPPKEMQ